MSTPLDEYKAFIDEIVDQRQDMSARWVMEKREWPDFPENKAINDFVSSLDDSQRKVLATMLQHSRDGGIHDVLGFLNELMSMERLRLIIDDNELPCEPFGSEMHYDWTCRKEGDAWPEPDVGE
jgi:hypothetical protein